MAVQDGGPVRTVRRLQEAVASRDLELVVACFAPHYRNDTPAHPQRSFTGRDQVRQNWLQIFAAVPDIEAEVTHLAVAGDVVWTEWEHRGTRPDGTRHLMRGVVIFGVEDELIAWARFYLEPVEAGGGGVSQAVRRQVRSEVGA
jgi:ketosteroid isomerase-like protein